MIQYIRRVLDLRDIVFLAAIVILSIGLAGYDWRLACVVVGSLLLIISNWQSIRGLMRNGPAD